MAALTLLFLAFLWQGPPPVPEAADDFVVARAGDLELRWSELDALLLARHGQTDTGRESLHHLAETLTVQAAAKEARIAISEASVDARESELEGQVRSGGGSLDEYLRNANLSRPEFRYFLEVGMEQEELTRRALGLGAGASVNPDQTRLWIQEELTNREAKEFPAPWSDGVVWSAKGVTIRVGDYAHYLRRRLPSDELHQDCFQYLLYEKVRARLPDVTQSKVDEYVQQEIERRRREALLNPKNKGLPFERLLAAQGLTLESLARDPALIVSALSKLWVDRAYDAETLKRTYQNERPHFDDLYGEAIDTSLIFLRAAQFKNEFQKRTFDEAQAQLRALGEKIQSLADFQKAARAQSEDPKSKESDGSLGWLTSSSAGAPPEVRAEIKKRIAHAPTPDELAGEGLVGPLRTSTGCVLLWLGPRRPAPAWDKMAAFVQLELRKRFLDEALPPESVTYNIGIQGK
ncbi:MAG: peptidylprolyl isomerase [Planctomycetes bacterium]|nr:peptidylprolyl isomerase [Planctomycetota bacterium]